MGTLRSRLEPARTGERVHLQHAAQQLRPGQSAAASGGGRRRRRLGLSSDRVGATRPQLASIPGHRHGRAHLRPRRGWRRRRQQPAIAAAVGKHGVVADLVGVGKRDQRRQPATGCPLTTVGTIRTSPRTRSENISNTLLLRPFGNVNRIASYPKLVKAPFAYLVCKVSQVDDSTELPVNLSSTRQ